MEACNVSLWKETFFFIARFLSSENQIEEKEAFHCEKKSIAKKIPLHVCIGMQRWDFEAVRIQMLEQKMDFLITKWLFRNDKRSSLSYFWISMNQNISCLLERKYFCIENPITYLQTYRTCISSKSIKELILMNIFGYIPTKRVHWFWNMNTYFHKQFVFW